VTFVIDDGTGRAIIDPTGARVAVDIDMTTRSGTFDDATPVEEQFLIRHGLRASGWMFNRTLRYREGVIEVGGTHAVKGPGVPQPDSAGLGKLGVFGGVREFPMRVKCATLAWHTMKAALDQKNDPVSTE